MQPISAHPPPSVTQPTITTDTSLGHTTKESHQPAELQAPPTPAATASPSSTSSHLHPHPPPNASTSAYAKAPASLPGPMPLPSFLSTDPLSSDPDSSSSEDGFGYPKPAKKPRVSRSTGLPRPRPSYYYDEHYDPGTAGNKKKGRRGGYKGVPVFEPTMDDFAGNGGFYGYVKRIEKYGLRSGIVKVIPPKEWTASLPSTEAPLRDIRLREPIEQHMMGSQGLYRVTNVAKSRIYNPAQWKDLSTREKWEAPDLKGEKGRGERSERSSVSEKVRRRREANAKSKGKGKKKEEEEEELDEEEADGADDEEDEDDDDYGAPKKGRRTPAKAAPKKGKAKGTTTDSPVVGVGTLAEGEDVKMAEALSPSVSGTPAPSTSASLRASPAPSVASTTTTGNTSAPAPEKKKSKTALGRAEPSEAEWNAFKEKFEELPHGMKKEDYTVELMREFERRYWRTLTFGEAPIYGADMAGSLFTPDTSAWNVASLGDILPRLAPQACQIPGVVSPYLYFGMWRATFAWHVEDADLYSINYIHFGAPKFWYSVPQEQAGRFERVMEGYFPTDARKCHEFLRHKAFLASPRLLSNSGIVLNRCVQLPGEFILTYPKGYHSGFNLGFNCAESINFATERWIELGKDARHCRCIDDAVNIDVTTWLCEAAKAEALAKGEPWPYDDELEFDALSDPDPAPAPQQKKRMALAASSAAPAAKKPRPSQPRQQPQQYNPQPIQLEALTPEGKQQLTALLQHHQGVLPPELAYLNDYIPQLYGHPPALLHPPPPVPQPRQTPQENPYGRSSFVYQNQAIQPKPHRQPVAKKPTPAPARVPSSSSSVASSAVATAKKPDAPTPPPPKKVDYPCALCPEMTEEGLVKIAEPGKKTAGGMKAHRVCVMFTPATWIEVDPTSGEEIVQGYSKIEKARWKLKCQLCSESWGTKIQCTKGKCTKAYHVTCALREASGVFMDATIADETGTVVSILEAAKSFDAENAEAGGQVSALETAGAGVEGGNGAVAAAPPSPQKGEPGQAMAENDLIQLTVLCRTHNPDFQQRELARKAAELKGKIEALAPSARIRVRINGGGVFDVTLDKVDHEKETVSFIFDDGKRKSATWKMLIWPEDPDVARKKAEKQQKLQKAKDDAIDRPKYTNKAKRLSSTSGVGGLEVMVVQPSGQSAPRAEAPRTYYTQPPPSQPSQPRYPQHVQHPSHPQPPQRAYAAHAQAGYSYPPAASTHQHAYPVHSRAPYAQQYQQHQQHQQQSYHHTQPSQYAHHAAPSPVSAYGSPVPSSASPVVQRAPHSHPYQHASQQYAQPAPHAQPPYPSHPAQMQHHQQAMPPFSSFAGSVAMGDSSGGGGPGGQ
ncbi:hypothetical protein JCM11641_001664 [Rhodosporidiobolus odoratus]